MKIYLAGGFSVSNVKGREEALVKKYKQWQRLHSFYWMQYIINSNILKISADSKKGTL